MGKSYLMEPGIGNVKAVLQNKHQAFWWSVLRFTVSFSFL